MQNHGQDTAKRSAHFAISANNNLQNENPAKRAQTAHSIQRKQPEVPQPATPASVDDRLWGFGAPAVDQAYSQATAVTPTVAGAPQNHQNMPPPLLDRHASTPGSSSSNHGLPAANNNTNVMTCGTYNNTMPWWYLLFFPTVRFITSCLSFIFFSGRLRS